MASTKSFIAVVRTWGSSLGVTIPIKYARYLDLKPGDYIEIKVSGRVCACAATRGRVRSLARNGCVSEDKLSKDVPEHE